MTLENSDIKSISRLIFIKILILYTFIYKKLLTDMADECWTICQADSKTYLLI